MDSSAQFRAAGHQMIEYLAEYIDTIEERRVLPTVTPGYLRDLLPDDAPEQGESWDDIFRDVERVIMPGVTHWHSPHFHAYYPTAQSWPALLGDMLSSTIACIGFTWNSSPACTELEVVVMDWLGKLLKLPPAFLASSGGSGGGVIQGTASEATLVALLSARSKFIRKYQSEQPGLTDEEIIGKLVAYGSEQAHSSVERAAMLGGVKFRSLPSGKDYGLEPGTLEKVIKEDRTQGLIPFYVVGTLGTTPSCAFDDLTALGPVCQKAGVWLHVDAAYAGSAFICEEFRPLLNGVEYAQSFNFNPHKWMLVTFDCSAMWFTNASDVVDAFNVDPLYLKHDRQGQVPDYRHWQIPLGRRFRSLKLWFVLRSYGAEGLRAYIRKHVALAKKFHQHVQQDSRFEIVAPTTLGLVCFRLKGDDAINEKLLRRINENGKIHLVPSHLNQQYILRFAVCSRATEEKDIDFAWQEVKEQSEQLLQNS